MGFYNNARAAVVGCAALWLLVGCTSTKIVGSHPLAQVGGGSATVYFLRPLAERRMGFPDNPLAVDLNQEKLMDLGRGEYTVVQVVARDMLVTLRNQTEAGPAWAVKDMERQYPFTFKAGETYYLVIRPVDGEFRGVFFRPEMVDLATAQQVALQLHAAGPARSAPLPAP